MSKSTHWRTCYKCNPWAADSTNTLPAFHNLSSCPSSDRELSAEKEKGVQAGLAPLRRTSHMDSRLVGRFQPVSLSFVSGLATPALVLYISLLLLLL